MADDADGKELGMAECPKCSGLTADEAGGAWTCSKCGDLDGYQQCPRCGTLYKGTAPFCSSDCEDAGLP